jgi:hypothetical protein
VPTLPRVFRKLCLGPFVSASLHILGPGNPDTEAMPWLDTNSRRENDPTGRQGATRHDGVWFNEHPTVPLTPHQPICAKDMEPVTGGALIEIRTRIITILVRLCLGSHNVAVEDTHVMRF